MERRLAVILMADMVDYSRLMEADQAAAIGLIRELRERWLEPEVARHGGEVLKRLGDGWLVAFASTGEAVEAAMAVQQGLAGQREIRLRIAAHLGEIASDGTEVYGPGINIAARLQAEAPPGGVMISGDLHRQLDGRLAERFSDAGSFTLKNIAHPVAGFQWRPARPDMRVTDDLPVIAVERVGATPGTRETREAAADIQEHLFRRLAQLTDIRVLSLGAAPEVWPDPGIWPTYLLRGRLELRDGSARLDLSLLLSADGRTIWSAAFEEATDDLFAFCDDVVKRAENELRFELNAFDGERIAHLPDEALSPSEARARASYLFNLVTIEAHERIATLMERALQLDSDNAISHVMWVEARLGLAGARHEDLSSEAAARLAAAADRAARRAPRNVYVLEVRSRLRTTLGDLDGARSDVRRMRRINPSYALGDEAFGVLCLAAGDFTAAIDALGAAVAHGRRDPYLPLYLYGRAVAQLLAGRPTDAASSIAEAIGMRCECRAYWLLLAEAQARDGAGTEGAAARAEADALPDRPDILAPCLALPREHVPLMAALAPAG